MALKDKVALVTGAASGIVNSARASWLRNGATVVERI